MKYLFLPVFAFLLLASCSSKLKKVEPIQPASDPAIAAATSFTTTLTEVSLDKRGNIASGTIKTNAPLAAASAGTYSLSPRTGGSVSYPGEAIINHLGEKSSGKIRIRHSGDQTILELLNAEGGILLTIIGPPHGNGIQSSWFFEGAACGTATLQPGRAAP